MTPAPTCPGRCRPATAAGCAAGCRGRGDRGRHARCTDQEGRQPVFEGGPQGVVGQIGPRLTEHVTSNATRACSCRGAVHGSASSLVDRTRATTAAVASSPCSGRRRSSPSRRASSRRSTRRTSSPSSHSSRRSSITPANNDVMSVRSTAPPSRMRARRAGRRDRQRRRTRPSPEGRRRRPTPRCRCAAGTGRDGGERRDGRETRRAAPPRRHRRRRRRGRRSRLHAVRCRRRGRGRRATARRSARSSPVCPHTSWTRRARSAGACGPPTNHVTLVDHRGDDARQGVPPFDDHAGQSRVDGQVDHLLPIAVIAPDSSRAPSCIEQLPGLDEGSPAAAGR